MAELDPKFDCPENLQRQNNDADVEEDQERDEINNDADVKEDQGRDEINNDADVEEDQGRDEINNDADVEEDQGRDEINNDADVKEDQGRDEIKQDPKFAKFDCPEDLQRQNNDDVAVCRYNPHGVMPYFCIEGTYRFPLTIQRYASLTITISKFNYYTRQYLWEKFHILIPRRIATNEMLDSNIAYECDGLVYFQENGK